MATKLAEPKSAYPKPETEARKKARETKAQEVMEHAEKYAPGVKKMNVGGATLPSQAASRLEAAFQAARTQGPESKFRAGAGRTPERLAAMQAARQRTADMRAARRATYGTGLKSGGSVSKRADGIAKKGKTRGKMC